ncbi:MAG: glycosyltransferase family 2 protein [Halorientalis sp.]
MAEAYIDVVVPAYNEADDIADCLDSILEQDTERPFSVLVVDDGSTDETPEILAEYEREHERLRVVTKETNRGYGDTIRRGFEESTADIVCFVDGDSIVAPGSLAAVVEDYEAGADAVFGYVDVRNDDRLHGLYCKVGKRHDPDKRYGGALMSVRREVLEDLGGFLDVENRGSQDVEIKTRLRKSDYDVVFEDDAKVFSRFPEGWRNVMRQKFRAGKTHVIYSSQHPENFDPGIVVNTGYYAALLASVLASVVFPPAVVAVLLLAVLFFHEHGPRGLEMYRASGSLRMGLLFFPYALAAGYVRTAGYLSEWRKLLSLLRRQWSTGARGEDPNPPG